MERDEWKHWYKEGYRKAMKEWRDRLRDWRVQVTSNISEGITPRMPPMPPMPPLPHMPLMPAAGRSNVVASRIGDEELRLIDMMIEAGLFSTRSEAVAYLVAEGIKAKKDVIGKVSSAVEEIRKIRKEAEEQTAKLKREIGIKEPETVEETEELEKPCPKCGKDLSDLPGAIAMCPYCGAKVKRD